MAQYFLNTKAFIIWALCKLCVIVHSLDKADNLLMDGGCEFAFVFCISDLLNGGKRSRLNLGTVLHNCTIFGM